MEYHGIDFCFTEILFLGESGTFIWEDYYRNSLICGTARVSPHKHYSPPLTQCKQFKAVVWEAGKVSKETTKLVTQAKMQRLAVSKPLLWVR